MAVKVALVVLAVTAILAFVEVSGYRTSITTVAIQDNGQCEILPWFPFPEACGPDGLGDNPREQCDRQIPIQQLNHCQMHLTSSFGYKLRMPMENSKQQQHLSLCCKQLQQVEEQCQCKAIGQVAKQALKQLPQQAGGQQQQQQQQMMAEQMLKKAQNLPNQCNLKCSI
uniref:PawS1d n=1 Tax=Zinnia haageana TaxID=1525732 RepID=A0A0A0V4K7_9ASTR|nr:PawS1d precursor [Zinnia haageana]